MKSLQQQIDDKQQHIDELNHLHQQTQINHEHYQELTNEERDSEQQQFNKQISLLEHNNTLLLQGKQQQHHESLNDNMTLRNDHAHTLKDNQSLIS